jgi:hypothetical protein
MLLERCRALCGRLESAAVAGGGGGAGSSAQEVNTSQEDKLKAKLVEAEGVLDQMTKLDKTALERKQKQIRQEISSERRELQRDPGERVSEFEDREWDTLGRISDLEGELHRVTDQINCAGMKSLVDLLKRAVGEGWLHNGVGLQEAERELRVLNEERLRLEAMFDPLLKAREQLELDKSSTFNWWFGNNVKIKNEIDRAKEQELKAWKPLEDVLLRIFKQEKTLRTKQMQHQTALRLLTWNVHTPVTKDVIDSITPRPTR